MVLIAIVAIGGVILLLGGIGLVFWELWMRWYVEECRRAGSIRSLLGGSLRGGATANTTAVAVAVLAILLALVVLAGRSPARMALISEDPLTPV